MQTQRHPRYLNLILLLIAVWLSVVSSSYAFSFKATVNTLNTGKQDTLRIYTDNDDVALESKKETQKEFQEKSEEAFFRTACLTQLLARLRSDILEALAIFSGFVPLQIFRYLRRRTRTPSCSLVFSAIH